MSTKNLKSTQKTLIFYLLGSNAFHSGTKLFSVVFRLCNFVFFSDTFPSLPSLGSADLEHANLASTPQREVEALPALSLQETPFPYGDRKINILAPNKIITDTN